MNIEIVSIDKIIPYINNPRKNTDTAIIKVASSIKEFGWQQPIVVDTENVIVVGHTRYLAAKKLELEKIPVVIASELTSAQIKAYRIADNRIAEESEWDGDLLSVEIEGLSYEDIDLSVIGFENKELERILSGESNAKIGSRTDLEDKFKLTIDFSSEEDCQILLDELIDRGFKVGVIS